MITLDNIKEKVRAIMNEIGEEHILSQLSEDTLKLDSYIEALLATSINQIIDVAPDRFFIPKVGSSSVVVDGENIATINVPLDFKSLVLLRCKGMKRNISTLYNDLSGEYKIAENESARPRACKPIGILTFGSAGNRIIRIYTLEKGTVNSTIEIFLYIPIVENAPGFLPSIRDELFEALCYLTASNIYLTFENLPMAEKLKEKSAELIPKS